MEAIITVHACIRPNPADAVEPASPGHWRRPLGGGAEGASGGTHLKSIPFAIIPRRISRVPPRSENDGTASVV